MSYGSAAFPRAPRGHDHPVVARLRAAGAVVVGLTNLPELAILPVHRQRPTAIARKPVGPAGRTPGRLVGEAPAGGGGVRACPASRTATDGLGSVRIPAAACGLFGIKPGNGPWFPGDLETSGWYGLSESGPARRHGRRRGPHGSG